jgi:hypothetical protein
MNLTTPQYRILKSTRQSNAEGRGLIAPKGISSLTFKRLAEAGLLEDRAAGMRVYWITDAGRAVLASAEGSAPAAAVPAWPTIVTFADLKAAIRGGSFDLVQMPGTFKFALKRGTEFSTSEKLVQIAEHASQSQWVMFMAPLPDGSRLYKLTTRA